MHALQNGLKATLKALSSHFFVTTMVLLEWLSQRYLKA